jgi:hypothetical protein
MLGIGVVGSGLGKQRLVTGVPWAVTARLVHGRGGRPTVKGGIDTALPFSCAEADGEKNGGGEKIGAPVRC